MFGFFEIDSQRSMLQGITKERNLRSKFWWFTEFCNSHYVSHFAAFFIVTRTKISTAKSCSLLINLSWIRVNASKNIISQYKIKQIDLEFKKKNYSKLTPICFQQEWAHLENLSQKERLNRHRSKLREVRRVVLETNRRMNIKYSDNFVNDPSAGSPTETLLRLLLPLNDKIQTTSRDA